MHPTAYTPISTRRSIVNFVYFSHLQWGLSLFNGNNIEPQIQKKIGTSGWMMGKAAR